MMKVGPSRNAGCQLFREIVPLFDIVDFVIGLGLVAPFPGGAAVVSLLLEGFELSKIYGIRVVGPGGLKRSLSVPSTPDVTAAAEGAETATLPSSDCPGGTWRESKLGLATGLLMFPSQFATPRGRVGYHALLTE
jgi:hypothetical protein